MYTKTTEIRGRWYSDMENVQWIGDISGGEDLKTVLPGEATTALQGDVLTCELGPRGTFRITVEFTPDEPKET